MTYQNWKISKSELAEKSDEYSTVAQWCNDNEKYTIQEIDDEYCVVPIPQPSINEQNTQIRQTRQYLFTQYADPIKFEYEENKARYGDDDESTKFAKQEWLAKKDEIRNNNPYIGE